MNRLLLVWGRLGFVQRVIALIVPIALVAALGGAAAFVLATGPGPVAVVNPPQSSPAATLPPLPP